MEQQPSPALRKFYHPAQVHSWLLPYRFHWISSACCTSALAVTGPVRPQLPAPTHHMGSTPAKKLLLIDTDPGIGEPVCPAPLFHAWQLHHHELTSGATGFGGVLCALRWPIIFLQMLTCSSHPLI